MQTNILFWVVLKSGMTNRFYLIFNFLSSVFSSIINLNFKLNIKHQTKFLFVKHSSYLFNDKHVSHTSIHTMYLVYYTLLLYIIHLYCFIAQTFLCCWLRVFGSLVLTRSPCTCSIDYLYLIQLYSFLTVRCMLSAIR